MIRLKGKYKAYATQETKNIGECCAICYIGCDDSELAAIEKGKSFLKTSSTNRFSGFVVYKAKSAFVRDTPPIREVKLL
jgi:hypothetical protein